MENIPLHKHAEIINQHTKDGFGVLLITCGNCGGIIAKRVNADCEKAIKEEDISCPYCKRDLEEFHCPDLFY